MPASRQFFYAYGGEMESGELGHDWDGEIPVSVKDEVLERKESGERWLQ